MNLNIKIRFFTDEDSWLCFRHAVAMASKDVDVSTDIDEYGSEGDMRTTSCIYCAQEIVLG